MESMVPNTVIQVYGIPIVITVHNTPTTALLMDMRKHRLLSVDKNGGYYGTISANKYAEDRIETGVLENLFSHEHATARALWCNSK